MFFPKRNVGKMLLKNSYVNTVEERWNELGFIWHEVDSAIQRAVGNSELNYCTPTLAFSIVSYLFVAKISSLYSMLYITCICDVLFFRITIKDQFFHLTCTDIKKKSYHGASNQVTDLWMYKTKVRRIQIVSVTSSSLSCNPDKEHMKCDKFSFAKIKDIFK
jgi:hypothetical protein